jgi:hypothetical protein
MDTSKLKPFAQEARRTLRAQVSARLDLVLADQSAARREQPKAVAELESEIARTDRDLVVERVAYTWFNRFTALRFMDANGYTRLKVVSPSEGQTRPEILAEAAAGNVDDEAPAAVREKVAALLDGRTPSADAQGEAYRLLLVAACNQWHATMPFMLEKIADYTELLLPEDLLSSDSLLGKVRAVMTQEACQDVEIIGWLYQFYISEKKDEVFAGLKKNKKITAENIPAATQLFTPHWIVRYLVENSLGRLWLLNRPSSKLAAKMDYFIAPVEDEADFLRISRPEDIRICDPACGSGHMLTYAFDLLYAIYEEEGYEASEIPGLILTHNLHGIEIDDRAGGLAAFALAMKAATKLGRRRFLRQAVELNICVLQDVRFTPSEMQDVATVVGSDLYTAEFCELMGQFEQAKNFGSLIMPKLRNPAEVARVVRLKDFGGDLLLREVQERVLNVLEMAQALSPNYHLVVANPPYMGSGGMNAALAKFLEVNFASGKNDLMTAFITRGLNLACRKGLFAGVTLDSWMFLSSFQSLRGQILEHSSILSLLHIGWNCFPDGHVYNRGVAFVLSNGPSLKCGNFVNLSHLPATTNKETAFLDIKRTGGPIFKKSSQDLRKLPSCPIAYWLSPAFEEIFEKSPSLSTVAEPRKGMVTADNPRFIRMWHEVAIGKAYFGAKSREDAKSSARKWFPYLKGGAYRRWYGNQEYLVNWENDGSELLNMKGNGYKVGSTNHNFSYIFSPAITWTKVTSGRNGFRLNGSGFLFDDAAGLCAVYNIDQINSILAYLNSPVVYAALAALTPTINLNPGSLALVPFVHVSEVAKNAARCVDIAAEDWNESETSWDFLSHPLLTLVDRSQKFGTAFAEVCSLWERRAHELQRLEEENNRVLIERCGLSGEVNCSVPISDVALNCNFAFRYGSEKTSGEALDLARADVISDFISYAVGCMFGRYSLDAPGLVLANQGEGLEEYLSRVPRTCFEPDTDNVIPVLEGDWFADDITERFRKFLRVTFGDEHFSENLAFLEEAIGKDIRKYFTRDFFNDHVKRYKKRPIYWLFSSPRGSFQALIYMHRYRPDTVSVVLNDYLREYRNKLEAHRKSLEALSGSAEATPAQRTRALKEIGEVSKVIEELDGYERDVLYPLATQKLEIDLDDGVKANYPKFGAALRTIKGLSDADD